MLGSAVGSHTNQFKCFCLTHLPDCNRPHTAWSPHHDPIGIQSREAFVSRHVHLLNLNISGCDVLDPLLAVASGYSALTNISPVLGTSPRLSAGAAPNPAASALRLARIISHVIVTIQTKNETQQVPGDDPVPGERAHLR